MSRDTSSGFRAALYAQESEKVVACLLTITHADLPEPLRISTDATSRLTSDPVTYGTTSRGNDFLFVPVSVVLPEDVSDAAPRAQLEVDNTDLAFMNLVRSITTPPSVTIELIMAAAPDVVEIEFPGMLIGSVSYNVQTVSFELTVDALFTEPYPGNRFVPSAFPGLF